MERRDPMRVHRACSYSRSWEVRGATLLTSFFTKLTSNPLRPTHFWKRQSSKNTHISHFNPIKPILMIKCQLKLNMAARPKTIFSLTIDVSARQSEISPYMQAKKIFPSLMAILWWAHIGGLSPLGEYFYQKVEKWNAFQSTLLDKTRRIKYYRRMSNTEKLSYTMSFFT